MEIATRFSIREVHDWVILTLPLQAGRVFLPRATRWGRSIVSGLSSPRAGYGIFCRTDGSGAVRAVVVAEYISERRAISIKFCADENVAREAECALPHELAYPVMEK